MVKKKKPRNPAGRAGKPVNIPVDFDQAMDGIVKVPKSEIDKEQEKKEKREKEECAKEKDK